MHTGSPLYLLPYLPSYNPPRALRSASQDLVVPTYLATVTASRSFSLSVSNVWNQLPIQLRMTQYHF